MAAGRTVGGLQRGGDGVIVFDKWVLPDGEQHLQEWMSKANRRVDGRLTYQYHKYEAARRFCTSRRVAIDVGAHCALWSFWMARDFAKLHAFEPKPDHVSCWTLNMEGVQNADLAQVALGPKRGTVGLFTGASSSGNTYVVEGGTGVEMRTLDSYAFENVDLIKIDCEGYEVFVLEGARDTLERCKPVVIVEQKPGHGQNFGRGERDAVKLLQSMGARQVWDYAGDYVLRFERAS